MPGSRPSTGEANCAARGELVASIRHASTERDYADPIATMRERVEPLLVAPTDGTNRVIVGHNDLLEAVTGISSEPMGVTYGLRPGPDRIEVLAN